MRVLATAPTSWRPAASRLAAVALSWLLTLGALGCSEPETAPAAPAAQRAGEATGAAGAEAPRGGGEAPAGRFANERADERAAMVREQIAARGVEDERVLAAMRRVPRHRFVSASWRSSAYEDSPLPIGHEQTISQPYIVALMSELARVEPGDRVLEIGTGSGYQAAVLAELGAEVYSIEIVRPLGERTRELLEELGYGSVHVRIGDGYQGWPEHAPFDAVLLTAAPPEIPQPLLEQMAVGARLVAPVGRGTQELVVITRTEAGHRRERSIPVRFVPMTGRAQED